MISGIIYCELTLLGNNIYLCRRMNIPNKYLASTLYLQHTPKFQYIYESYLIYDSTQYMQITFYMNSVVCFLDFAVGKVSTKLCLESSLHVQNRSHLELANRWAVEGFLDYVRNISSSFVQAGNTSFKSQHITLLFSRVNVD